MLCALIMAGGKGTRFWPLSTEEKPKQFLSLLGEETMIQMTVERLLPLISMERIFVVTGKQYLHLVKEQLPNLPEENIILEPFGKNTAPCIALSAFQIYKKYKNATIAVLPSDHMIRNEQEFLSILREAYDFVEKKEEAIVTIGIKPDRPDTGYGYIKEIDNGQLTMDNQKIFKVEKFVEKPCLEKAKEYLEDGNYLWNAGMFIWKTNNIIELTKRYLNNTFNILNELALTSAEDYEEQLEEKYNYVDSISIDYGILEKHDKIYVIPGDFGWDDVGSWDALERYCKKDENGNIEIGNTMCIQGTNNIIISNGKPIVISGLDNVFIVESDDVIVVGNKNNINKIREIKNINI